MNERKKETIKDASSCARGYATSHVAYRLREIHHTYTHTGTLEPHYRAVDGLLQRDTDASFDAYITVSDSVDAKGHATRQPLKKFTCHKNLQGERLGDNAMKRFTTSSSTGENNKSQTTATAPLLVTHGSASGGSGSGSSTNEHGKQPQGSPPSDDSATEENTENQESTTTSVVPEMITMSSAA